MSNFDVLRRAGIRVTDTRPQPSQAPAQVIDQCRGVVGPVYSIPDRCTLLEGHEGECE